MVVCGFVEIFWREVGAAGEEFLGYLEQVDDEVGVVEKPDGVAVKLGEVGQFVWEVQSAAPAEDVGDGWLVVFEKGNVESVGHGGLVGFEVGVDLLEDVDGDVVGVSR